MKLYCRGKVILATHDDSQDVDPTVYGDDVKIVQIASWSDLPKGYTYPVGEVSDS